MKDKQKNLMILKYYCQTNNLYFIIYINKEKKVTNYDI